MILLIDIFNFQEIEYVKNDGDSHDSIVYAYEALNRAVASTGIYPGLAGGRHLLDGVTYSDIVIYNPTSDRDYLLSPYIAIPTTNNPIITELYTYYYLHEARINEVPALSQASPLFGRIITEDYFLKASPLLLIRFLEAYLNTEERYNRSDLKSYSYALLYHYIEHVAFFDQYVTYEQKGIAIQRANILSMSMCIDSDFSHLVNQFLRGILPFLEAEYSKQPDDFVIVTSKGQIDLSDMDFLFEAFTLLKDSERSIKNEVLSLAEGYDCHPRDPRNTNSEDTCVNMLRALKQHWLH
jgi:hypothetical protein